MARKRLSGLRGFSCLITECRMARKRLSGLRGFSGLITECRMARKRLSGLRGFSGFDVGRIRRSRHPAILRSKKPGSAKRTGPENQKPGINVSGFFYYFALPWFATAAAFAAISSALPR
jgi:hypothetical protein